MFLRKHFVRTRLFCHFDFKDMRPHVLFTGPASEYAMSIEIPYIGVNDFSRYRIRIYIVIVRVQSFPGFEQPFREKLRYETRSLNPK